MFHTVFLNDVSYSSLSSLSSGNLFSTVTCCRVSKRLVIEKLVSTFVVEHYLDLTNSLFCLQLPKHEFFMQIWRAGSLVLEVWPARPRIETMGETIGYVIRILVLVPNPFPLTSVHLWVRCHSTILSSFKDIASTGCRDIVFTLYLCSPSSPVTKLSLSFPKIELRLRRVKMSSKKTCSTWSIDLKLCVELSSITLSEGLCRYLNEEALIKIIKESCLLRLQ